MKNNQKIYRAIAQKLIKVVFFFFGCYCLIKMVMNEVLLQERSSMMGTYNYRSIASIHTLTIAIDF